MSSLPHKSIFERGAWYVVVQGILIGLILFGPQGPLLISSEPTASILQSCGIAIGLLACLIMAIAVINLGKNLTPLPCPKDNAVLIKNGLYQFVRHPIYFGVLLAALAWLLISPGIYILLYAIGLFFLFDIKARREEVWLVERFPDYQDYQRRVKKLIPTIY
ncbi:isoprenylcysteine carboxylmethyltransferase family protein [Polynucleobacter sp. AP-Sving-400A-A2]|uniref:methyltransferase family protein n=1 Tax=Polynucleobacter sp. AP-Sving-400A-A2 TaxID=2081049 RepID=UPI001BFEC012|nr:isoprenylcysteine carboxylmethyltransferase family protein [Polynucleobacter sp. AP-Sving-400A-A2]QWE13979.1 isoprenylcysteine carboxylmethyltransferase family protein [Polynucleobacter sp. AP-Sving-400A-A2]